MTRRKVESKFCYVENSLSRRCKQRSPNYRFAAMLTVSAQADPLPHWCCIDGQNTAVRRLIEHSIFSAD